MGGGYWILDAGRAWASGFRIWDTAKK